MDHLGRPQVEALEVGAEGAAGADRVEQHVAVAVVDADLDVAAVLEPVHERPHAADVVDVPMGVEQRGQPQLVLLQPRSTMASGSGRGVDEHALAAGPVGRHEPAVGLRQPQGEAFDEHDA